MMNTVITEILVIFILFIPIMIKIFISKKINGESSKNKNRLPAIGTVEAFTHTCQGFLFGVCFRLSSLHPIFLILSYILGTFYPLYNLTKRLCKNRQNFRESSYYMNLFDFVLGFTVSIIGVETYSHLSGNLKDVLIPTNVIYYFVILYLTITIISLMFTFQHSNKCIIYD